MFKKLRLTFVLIILFITSSILCSCSFWRETHLDVSTYDPFIDQLFYSIIGEDEMTCNMYFENRENFGLSAYEPELPKPTLSSYVSKLVTNAYIGRIEGYHYDELNDDQKMTYNLITNLLDYINAVTPEMGYLSNNYLGTYLGYQAQLPLLLSEYEFRNETDIINYLKYVDLIPDAFKSYYEFEIQKADHGYGMPDFVIDNVVSQCNSFVEGIDNHSTFMYDVIEDKIDSCTFLDSDQKTYYKARNEEAVSTSMREGYLYVANNLGSLKGRSTNDMGLAHYVTSDGYNIGQAYYEAKFKYVVGYDDSCSDAIKYIDNKISTYYNELRALALQINSNAALKEELTKIQNNEIMLMTGSPEEQLSYFMHAIESDFPSLGYEPEIVVKYIDPSMQNNFSPAAYMTSPIDATTAESIYLNPASVYLKDENGELTDTLDGNYLYNTLAHEGLPGHLYQNCYFKNQDVHPLRKLLKNGGFTEGWATYVENYVYEYARNMVSDTVIDYLIASTRFEAAVYSRLDLGIHYDGWTVEEAYNFMNKYYSLKGIDKFTAAYQQLVEIPTNYQQYFYTYLKLVDLHDTVESALGSNFDPVNYHETILKCGSVPLKYIEKIVYEKYGISQ